MRKNIAVLAGDGIGPEVMKEAVRVLRIIERKFGHSFELQEALVGGAAYDRYKCHLPSETLEICKASDAILFGSVGGPVTESHLDKWKGCETNSILALRKTFNFCSNLRPAKVYKELMDICPIKTEIISKGVDVLIVRELLGDLYFGEHSQFISNGLRIARDVAEYTEDQIRNVAQFAFRAALNRRCKLTSVDKANVLETSKLWRTVIKEVSKDFPAVSLEDMLVDNAAMQIIKNPGQFDVIVTTNMFGDILSDAAAVLPGSLGLTPSASLNKDGFGLYEPSGGSAPDIANKGIANPIAQILSLSLMLEHSFQMINEARTIEDAITKTLTEGYRTKELALPGQKSLGTTEFTDLIIKFIT